MSSFENHAPVYNQVGVQNIYGHITLEEDEDAFFKRMRGGSKEPDAEKKLDDDILASLAFPHMFNRKNTIESAHRRTCQWVFDLHDYRTWRSKPNGLIWIKGKPGSGKSTLMLHLYHDLWSKGKIDNDINLEFFFSGRGAPLQRTPIGMLRSLLNQLFYQDSGTRKLIRTIFQEKTALFGSSNSDQWEWQLPELKRLFADMVCGCASRRQMTLLIDAVDEAGREAAAEVASYLHTINDRIIELGGKARICISCRHYPIPSNIQAVEIFMESHNHDDIALYIGEHIMVHNLPYSESQQDQADIASILVNMANGVFQWARLVTPIVIERLSDGYTAEQIYKSLSNIPKDLEAIYDYILMNVIEPQFRRKALRLFQWACLAQRPLSVRELRYALCAEAIKTGATSTRCHETSDFEYSGQKMSHRIKTWSGGLLETTIPSSGSVHDYDHDEFRSRYSRSDLKCDAQTVQVIHQSVNDFLMTRGLSVLLALDANHDSTKVASVPFFDSPTAIQISHSTIYISCLKYLCTEHIDQDTRQMMDDASRHYRKLERLNFSFPFLIYAGQFGFIHAEKAGEHRFKDLENESQLLNQSIDPCTFAAGPFQDDADDEDYSIDLWTFEPGTTVLHLAAAANLLDLIEYRIACNDDLNERTETGWTPVHAAAVRGHLAAVMMLQNAGANLKSETETGETPLAIAARRGHNDIFSFLLNHSVNLDSIGTKLETVLQVAALEGRTTICRLCIQFGADINAQGGHYGSALHAAAISGHEAVVRLLLQAGADINIQGGVHGTVLQTAVQWDHGDIISLLLKAGIDINAQSRHNGSALQVAAAWGREEIVHLLLKAGANVNAQGGQFGSALQAAACQGNERILRLLIDAGVNVNAREGHFSSALQTAVFWGCEKVVHILLEAGADVNAQGGVYGNALQLAVYLDRKVLVKLLIKVGANVNAQGGVYGSALQAAACHSSAEVVKLLLKAGADVNARGGLLGNALRAAELSRRIPTVERILRAAGAEEIEHCLESSSIDTWPWTTSADDANEKVEKTRATSLDDLAGEPSAVKDLVLESAEIPTDTTDSDPVKTRSSNNSTGEQWLSTMQSRFFLWS